MSLMSRLPSNPQFFSTIPCVYFPATLPLAQPTPQPEPSIPCRVLRPSLTMVRAHTRTQHSGNQCTCQNQPHPVERPGIDPVPADNDAQLVHWPCTAKTSRCRHTSAMP